MMFGSEAFLFILICAGKLLPSFTQIYFTARQRSCAKVMFSDLSVCPRGGREEFPHMAIRHDALDLVLTTHAPSTHSSPSHHPITDIFCYIMTSVQIVQKKIRRYNTPYCMLQTYNVKCNV